MPFEYPQTRRVVIVGAGAVGSTFAYSLAQAGCADEIVLIDKNVELADGQAQDLAHGLPFYSPVQIRAGSGEDYADAAVIVITAGAKQRPGETRLDLLERNKAIVGSIADEIIRSRSHAIIVMATNPVDVMTAFVQRRCGWPVGQIFGSGTVLDSARFRYFISRHCKVNAQNVHAYILGEHGDSEFAAWSLTNIAGIPVADFCADLNRGKGECDCTTRQALDEIVAQVRTSAYHIIGAKGATDFGIGMAMTQIVRSILRNERRVLTVSAYLTGEYGLQDVAIGVPSIVGRNGIEHVLQPKLTDDELAALTSSAKTLADSMQPQNP